MAAKKPQTKKSKVENVAEEEPVEVKVNKDTVLVFKAKKALSRSAFNLAAEMLRKEQEATGVKVILEPFSVDLKK